MRADAGGLDQPGGTADDRPPAGQPAPVVVAEPQLVVAPAASASPRMTGRAAGSLTSRDSSKSASTASYSSPRLGTRSGRASRGWAAMGRRRHGGPVVAVVVEDHLSVGGDPGVALQARRPEGQGRGERLQGVLPAPPGAAPVGEPDRHACSGRKRMHSTMVAEGPAHWSQGMPAGPGAMIGLPAAPAAAPSRIDGMSRLWLLPLARGRSRRRPPGGGQPEAGPGSWRHCVRPSGPSAPAPDRRLGPGTGAAGPAPERSGGSPYGASTTTLAVNAELQPREALSRGAHRPGRPRPATVSPQAARTLGRFMAEMRRMSTSFQDEVRDALGEPPEAFELGDLRLPPARICRRSVRDAITTR